MRADEKIDPELERVEEEEIVEQLEEKQEPAQEQVAEVDTSAVRFYELAAYIASLLGEQTAAIELGWLSEVERQGIDLLTAAIEGRASGTSRQLFAEDRMVMLEQALAALQPALAAGFELAGVDTQIYDDMVEDLGELRAALSSLADAQEEVQAQDTMNLLGRDGKPPPKKPPDPGEVGDDRPSTLAAGGPVAADKPALPSTLAAGGPAAADKPALPSTLATGGPPAPDKKPPPSEAWDGDDRARR